MSAMIFKTHALRMLVSSLALALGASAATAQVPIPGAPAIGPLPVEEGVAIFEERCKMALFDPNAFIASVPPTLPTGGSAFAQSPDNQVLTAHEFRDPWFVDFYISSTGTHRMTRCSVHSWASIQYQGNPELPGPMAERLKSVFAGRPDGPLVGGVMPANYAQIYGEAVLNGPEYQQHFYSVSLDWGEARVPVWVDLHNGGFSMVAVLIEENAQ